MGSQPIGRVHLLSDEDTGVDIPRRHLALSSTQARISAFHAEELGSTPGRVTIWALGLHGVVASLARRIFRWIRFPQGPP